MSGRDEDSVADPISMSLEPEAGIDRAAELLQRYDRKTRKWNVDKGSAFWRITTPLRTVPPESPAIVAIIDTAFDLTIAALSEQELVGNNDPNTSTVHGSTVALLALEVAPWSHLLLYPVGRDGRLDADLVASAIDDAVTRGVQVINLSMSSRRPVREWFDYGFYLSLQDAAISDKTIAQCEVVARFPFLPWIQVPATPVGDAALKAVRRGVKVVAATGNENRTLSTPAALPGVIAAAFISERRTTGLDGGELATPGVPSFAQSAYSDIALIQPREVLGSSFATPLFSAFIASACQMDDVDRYMQMVRIHGAAAEMMALCATRGGLTPTHEAIIWWTFLRALEQAPHAHHLQSERLDPCLTCEVFAAETYVDAGLHALKTGKLDEADQLLRTVRTFAPGNPFAAANLAVLFAERANRVLLRDASSLTRRVDFLELAAEHMTAAVELRPDYNPYHEQLGSYRLGIIKPTSWTRLEFGKNEPLQPQH